ncbi:MAG: zinc ribbon domain-containing protein [Euryarchaeota archaeon]|nr:zinc ribbon domain-containing protein [Euryarchaeota archaeon]
MKKLSVFIICLMVLSIGSVEKTEVYTVGEKALIEITMDREYDLDFVLDVENGKGYVEGTYDPGVDITKYNQKGAFYICNDGSNVYFVSDIDLKGVFEEETPTIDIKSEFLTTEEESYLNGEFTVDEKIPEINKLNFGLELSKSIRIKADATFSYETEIEIENAKITIEKENNILNIDIEGKIRAGGLEQAFLTAPMLESLLKQQYNIDAKVHELAYKDGELSVSASLKIKGENIGEYKEFVEFIEGGELEINGEGGNYNVSLDLRLNTDACIDLMEKYSEEDPDTSANEKTIKQLNAIKESGAKFKIDLGLDFGDEINGNMASNCENFDKYYEKAKEMDLNVPLNKGKVDINLGEDLESNIAVRIESKSNIRLSGELEDKFYIKGNIDLDREEQELLQDAGITYMAFDGKKICIEFEDIDKLKNNPLWERAFGKEPKELEEFKHREIKEMTVEKPEGVDDELEYLGYEKEKENIWLLVGSLIIILLAIAAIFLFRKKKGTEKYCDNCGFKLKEGAKKCPNCGKEL